MYNYEFENQEIEKLFQNALSKPWDVYGDIDWEQGVNLDHFTQNKLHSLIESIPEFSSLSLQQRQELCLKEVIYHISNALAGEHKGIVILANCLQECPQESLDIPYFISSILADERNHSIALLRYVKEKVGVYYKPHPSIHKVLEDLIGADAYEVKLFVGQVALEWTIVSLLSSLVLKNPEPLLKKILQRILKDEGRHLAFNHWVFAQLSSDHLSRLQRPIEDLFFESIVAVTASLFAIPVWQEYGFSQESCRQYVIQELERRGVVQFYSKILPRKFSQCGFYSERLIGLLEKELVHRLVQEHWHFEPNVKWSQPC